MSTHFPNPNFDPHKEAIDGPTPDPWADVRGVDNHNGLLAPAPVPARPVIDFDPVVDLGHAKQVGQRVAVVAFGLFCFVMGGAAVYAVYLMGALP